MAEITVRLLGVAKDAAGKDQTTVSLPEGADVQAALDTLIEAHGEPLRDAIIDPVTGTPVATLILINGVEMGNLQDLETPLHPGDEIVILSVTHGG